MVYGFFIWILEFIFDFCYLKIKMYFYKYPKNRDGIKSYCVIECSNCVVEKTVRRTGRAWRISM
jgi:hypothetical protein